MAKVYEVIKTTKQDMKGIAVKHKGVMRHLKFNKWGALRVKDKSLAHDLEQQHGYHNGDGAVVVAEVDQQVSNDKIHRYFFTNPGLPWAKYDELGRRLPDDKENQDGERTVQSGERGLSGREHRLGHERHPGDAG